MRSVSYFLVPFSNAFLKVHVAAKCNQSQGKKNIAFFQFFLDKKTYFYQAVNCLKFLSQKSL